MKNHPKSSSRAISASELQELLEKTRRDANLDPEIWKQVLDQAEILQFSSGKVLVWEGDEVSNYYILLRGSLRVQKRSQNGRQITMLRVHPGESCAVCVACLMSGQLSPTEMIAESDLVVATVPKKSFFAIMAQHDEFRRYVFSSYGNQLGGMLGLASDLAFEQMSIRLARYLLHNCKDSDTLLRSHQEIAEDLGTVREVVSREIRAFKKMEVIEVSRGRITILNSVALGEMILDMKD